MAQVEVVITSVTETDEGGVFRYTLGFEEQASEPTTGSIADRSTQLQEVAKVFDGDKFTTAYTKLAKEHRSHQVKVTARKSGTEISAFRADIDQLN